MIGQGPIAILVFIYGTCRPIYKRENMSYRDEDDLQRNLT